MRAGLAAAMLLAVAASPAAAREPLLGLPIDCILGTSCFIQNYVDADPGPGGADFTCGPMSYDGHKGTDFALPSGAAMADGVAVIAAAPGRVIATRDGMPDTGLDGTPPEDLEGKDCGNGVVIDHGDGWQTQYCHLREGSVAVSKGDRVAMGAMLGQVGLSGRTQFPHLHLSLRQDKHVVDPFNTDEITTCGADDGPDDDLWVDPIAYVPGGLIAVGMSTEVPGFDAIKSGEAATARLPVAAPALVGWAHVFGGREGDVVEITLTRPDGSTLVVHEAVLEKAQARLFRAAGKKRPDGGWPAGDWTISTRLIRGGVTIDSRSAVIRVSD